MLTAEYRADVLAEAQVKAMQPRQRRAVALSDFTALAAQVRVVRDESVELLPLLLSGGDHVSGTVCAIDELRFLEVARHVHQAATTIAEVTGIGVAVAALIAAAIEERNHRRAVPVDERRVVRHLHQQTVRCIEARVANPAVDAMNLSVPNPRGGANITPDVSQFPGINPLWSPRLGFNWDVAGDRSTQVRGGTGVFSGRLPFVWISNQINANGVMRGQRGILADEWGEGNNPEWRGFQDDINAYRPDPSLIEAEIPTQVNVTADDFKLPQVWRSNIAVDHRLPYDIVGTADDRKSVV